MTTTPFYITQGKENALYSLYKYLEARFAAISPTPSPAINVYDTAYDQTMLFPCITMEDLGAPQLGDIAMGTIVGPNTKGRIEQTQVEFNVYAENTDSDRDAERQARRMRDILKYFLDEAGMPDFNGGLVQSAIKLIDSNNSDADTGSWVWHTREQDAHWTETFIKNTDEMPHVKRYRIYARIQWWWFEQEKTIPTPPPPPNI